MVSRNIFECFKCGEMFRHLKKHKDKEVFRWPGTQGVARRPGPGRSAGGQGFRRYPGGRERRWLPGDQGRKG